MQAIGTQRLLDRSPIYRAVGSFGNFNQRARYRPLTSGYLCLGLSDICPSRETIAARDRDLRAGVG
jgi:hypothetical protein